MKSLSLLQKLSWVENTNETLPAPAKPVSNDRLRQRVRQFIRREVQLKNEVDEYIRVSRHLCEQLTLNGYEKEQNFTNFLFNLSNRFTCLI